MKVPLKLILFGAIAVGLNVPQAIAQVPKRLKEFSARDINQVSVDRLGDLFLIFQSGAIKKYDANGRVLASLKKGTLPTLIEPWYHPRIFTYDRNQQHYTFYDHNLEFPQINRIDPAVAVMPFLVCPTNDNKLLVLDKADWSIKKINPNTNKVISEFNVDTVGLESPSFAYLREYQNLIFLLDKNSGILVFSNLGKKINHIKCKIENFGFYGEELFYLAEDNVKFFDLYSEKTREVKVESGMYVIVSDERIFLIRKDGRVTIFEFLADVSDEKPRDK